MDRSILLASLCRQGPCSKWLSCSALALVLIVAGCASRRERPPIWRDAFDRLRSSEAALPPEVRESGPRLTFSASGMPVEEFARYLGDVHGVSLMVAGDLTGRRLRST